MACVFRHLRTLAAGVLFVLAAPGAAHGQAAGEMVSFAVLMDGRRVGSQTVSVAKTADGWLISGFGNLDAPFNIVTTRLEISYDEAWQARRMSFTGTIDGRPVSLVTTLTPTVATNELVRGGEKASNVQRVSPSTVVLPDNFFIAYEALAARLASATPGTELPIYRAPEGETTATVNRVTQRRLLTGDSGRPVAIRDFALTLATARGPAPLEVWTDEQQRLVRIALPVSAVVVLREDLTSVLTREDHGNHPGDEAVFIPGNGFSLGATITKPEGVARPPAVILVAGPSVPGRDRVAHGIPSYGPLAGVLADAGYFVVRYDARGYGQSGGRAESASLTSYRDDVLSVVRWLRQRNDVDAGRIIVIGYRDSGAPALLAAESEGRIKGVALLATPGRTGREVVLDEQRAALDQLDLSEAERAERVALQTRIVDAAATGRGWDGVPEELRYRVDTPWFRSWVTFDPAKVIEDLRTPLLIVHGALDGEVPPADADRLETLSRTERRVPDTHTRKVVLPGLNHLFVPAATGTLAEYASLAGSAFSPAVGEAIVDWLRAIEGVR